MPTLLWHRYNGYNTPHATEVDLWDLPSPKPAPFLKLPAEIRNHIYGYLAPTSGKRREIFYTSFSPTKSTGQVEHTTIQSHLHLRLVCRQVRAEYEAIFVETLANRPMEVTSWVQGSAATTNTLDADRDARLTQPDHAHIPNHAGALWCVDTPLGACLAIAYAATLARPATADSTEPHMAVDVLAVDDAIDIMFRQMAAGLILIEEGIDVFCGPYYRQRARNFAMQASAQLHFQNESPPTAVVVLCLPSLSFVDLAHVVAYVKDLRYFSDNELVRLTVEVHAPLEEHEQWRNWLPVVGGQLTFVFKE